VVQNGKEWQNWHSGEPRETKSLGIKREYVEEGECARKKQRIIGVNEDLSVSIE
jgi:hypothetical protein